MRSLLATHVQPLVSIHPLPAFTDVQYIVCPLSNAWYKFIKIQLESISNSAVIDDIDITR